MNFLMIEKFDQASLPWRHTRRSQATLKLFKIILLVVPIMIVAAWILLNFAGLNPLQAATPDRLAIWFK